jgi:hypothetical protein
MLATPFALAISVPAFLKETGFNLLVIRRLIKLF